MLKNKFHPTFIVLFCVNLERLLEILTEFVYLCIIK